ncbi:glutamine ABC transporter substrate-binding protein [Lactobacillus delbrueckii subsp. bulgaricus]|nr:glutamine ABC transporter substrate-binding protein [Lactobacillus delbrueckii subsp. bulgaricus]
MRFAKIKQMLLIPFAALLMLVALAMPGQAQAASKKTYIIGTDQTFKPFEIQDKDGTYNGKNPGIDIEILREIAKHENFKYELKIMSFNADVQALQSGQIDGMIAGMSVTEERKKTIDFSNSYYTDGVCLAVAKDSKITGMKDLKGKTVNVKTGTTSAIYAKSIQKKYGFKLKYYTNSNTSWADVKAGNADACFDDGPSLRYGIANGTGLRIVGKQVANAPLAFAVKKGENQELLKMFNDGLAWLKKTGRLKKIVNKYTSKKAVKSQVVADTSILGLIKDNAGALLQGLWMTIELSIVGILAALVFGLILGIMGITEHKFWHGLANVIIYIFRGIPMMVLAFFIYIGMPTLLGHKLPLFTAGILTLMLDEGAYIGAIVRGGFESVDVGQWEAARSLGLPYYKALWKVVAPQGFKLMIPSLVNQFIITLKDTSILSAIGVMDLTQTGTNLIAQNFQGFKMWLIIAVMYLIIITLLTWLSNYIQKKMQH